MKRKLLLLLPLSILVLLLLESAYFSFINKQVRIITLGSMESPIGLSNSVPEGGISVIDFEKPVNNGISINEIELLSNADANVVRLKIWRLEDGVYKVVAQSKLLTLTKGVNLFTLDNMVAQRGDFLGLYMRLGEIDRSAKYRFKGRVYALGDADTIQENTQARDAQTGYAFTVKGTGLAIKNRWIMLPCWKS